VLSFSFDKGLLALLVYCLVNNGLFKVIPDICALVAASGPCHVLASCMLLHVAPSLVLNCVKAWTDWRPQNEMKSGVYLRRNSTVESTRWTGTTPAHWPVGNLFKYKQLMRNAV